MINRHACRLLPLLALLLAVLSVPLTGCTPATVTTPSSSATVTEPAATAGWMRRVLPPEGVVLDVPLLRQSDPRWESVPLGSSGATIGSEGCALASFAMVASYYGTESTPAQVVERLGEYAYPLEWVAAEPRYGFHVLRKDSIRFRDSRLHDPVWVRHTIEDSLAEGYPVIVGILQTSTGVPHFIVAYGLEPDGGGGFTILVRDPSTNSDYDRWEDVPSGWEITRLVVYQA